LSESSDYSVELVCPFCEKEEYSLKVEGHEIHKKEYAQETNNKIIKWVTHMFYDHGKKESAEVLDHLADLSVMLGGSKEEYFREMNQRYKEYKEDQKAQKEKLR
jgi:uncharacterized Zn finger protein (UPF0148 family)